MILSLTTPTATPPFRQGAHFVDTWIDGFAFQELSQEQTGISVQKEELEKQRKLLLARKKIVSSSGNSEGLLLVMFLFFNREGW